MSKKFDKANRFTLLSIEGCFSYLFYSLLTNVYCYLPGTVIDLYIYIYIFYKREIHDPSFIVLRSLVFVLQDLLTCSLFFLLQLHLSLIQWI